MVVDKAGMRSIPHPLQGKGHVCVFEYGAPGDSRWSGPASMKARQQNGRSGTRPVRRTWSGVPGFRPGCRASPNSPASTAWALSKTGMWAVLSSSPPRLCGKTRCGSSSTPSPQLSRTNRWFGGRSSSGHHQRPDCQAAAEAGATRSTYGSAPASMHLLLRHDVASRDKLIACRLNSVEEIAKEIGVDSLAT